MSELKVWTAQEIANSEKNFLMPPIKVYLKSEADKVIAELEAQVNGFYNRANLWHYNAQNEHNAAVAVRMENAKLKAKLAKKDKEIRHHKHKRCLAMAEKCEAWIRLDVSPRHTHRFIRWYKIWLELASKLKEVK